MSERFAVVLTKYVSFGKISHVNRFLPFIVSNEGKARYLLEQQFPDGWVVIGPKEFLLEFGFDLVEDDFDSALRPTGIPPVELPYEEKIENAVRGELFFHYDESREKLEGLIIAHYPNSELAKFILHTREEITKNGLKGMSGNNFTKGDVPIDFIISRHSKLATYERLAFEANQITESVASDEGEPLTFDDSQKKNINDSLK